ncbi:MAG: hypothetical protein CSB48_02885 [Proteobacteria bacterium]|nr:MAG: hypothetical protein CSB48_02885 [Pseudomonadota bacterium]
MDHSTIDNRRSEDYRLIRIEQKLDKIQEVLVAMARIEERQAQFDDLSQMVLKKIENDHLKLERLEAQVNQNSLWTSALSRLGWLIVAALTGAILKGWVML